MDVPESTKLNRNVYVVSAVGAALVAIYALAG